MSRTRRPALEEPVSAASVLAVAPMLGLEPMPDEVARQWEAHDKQQSIHRRIDALQHDGVVGPRFAAERFQKSDADIEAKNPDAWRLVRAWRVKDGCLYLEGGTGTGKSYAARCILFRGFYFNHTVAEVTARKLIRLTQEFKPSDLFGSLMSAKILLIDDIDKSAWNPSKIEALWYVLNHRWEHERRTIFTSNVPFDALSKLMLESVGQNQSLVRATMDRLKPLQVVKMLGESHR